MKTEDLLMTIYLLGCVVVVAGSFISAARGNWQGDDQGALSLLVCWFWPMLPILLIGEAWEKFWSWRAWKKWKLTDKGLLCTCGFRKKEFKKDCPYHSTLCGYCGDDRQVKCVPVGCRNFNTK